MKRIFSIISLFAVVMSFGSCMKGNNQEQSPVAAGIFIYNNVDATSVLAMDPISTVMRFNLLMQETTDYSTANLETIKSKDKLLSTTDIVRGTDDKENVFTITFNNRNGSGRSGELIIDTDGKTLFDDEGVWSVSLKDYSYADGYTVKYGTTSYNFIRSSTGSIVIDGSFVGYYKDNESAKASWTIQATADFGENETYEALKKTTAEVKFTLNASGKLLGATFTGSLKSGSAIQYFPEPVIYKPACRYMISSGTLTASMPELAITNPSEFPKGDVSYVFEKTSENCGVKTTVQYNGLSQVF